ncbi:MAG: hypothetical protein ABJA10_09020 [Aestuariivirga sp.]
MMEKSIHTLAGLMLKTLIQDTRTNGDKFWKLGDNQDGWMKDVIMEAHGDFMPDDWRYCIIRDCLSTLSEADENDDADALRDQVSEWADADTDVYNSALTNWLASNLNRGSYVDDAVSDFGYPADRGLYGALAIGQLREREEVYQYLINSLEALADAEFEVTP